MKNVLLTTLFLVSGCGLDVKHKVEGEPTTRSVIDFGFPEADAWCQKRYSPGTKEAEDCFEDYRNFTDVTIGFDFSGIIDFCKQTYGDDPVLEDDCRDDLINLLKNAFPKGTDV